MILLFKKCDSIISCYMTRKRVLLCCCT